MAAGMSLPSWPAIKAFCTKQFLPIGLIAAILFGFFIPQPGVWLSQYPINTISVVGIFFISGLQLQTQEVKRALTAWVPLLFGLVSILAITPLLGLAIVKFDLGQREFSQGLALFAAMPTTVSSGAMMTAEAGGNVALAIFFSVTTNLLGVLSVPFFLKAFLQEGSSSSGTGGGADAGAAAASLDPLDLLWKLCLSILLPLIIGKLLRHFPRVVSTVSGHKASLRYISAVLLISVPWLIISKSSDKLKAMGVGQFFLLTLLGTVLHLLLLCFNYAVCMILPMQLPEKKAVVINASQKTVNTAMSVISLMPEGLLDKGLLSLPCLLSHLVQVIIDSILVAKWKQRMEAEAAAAAAAAVAQAGAGAGAGAAASSEGTALAAAAAVEAGAVDFSTISGNASGPLTIPTAPAATAVANSGAAHAEASGPGWSLQQGASLKHIQLQDTEEEHRAVVGSTVGISSSSSSAWSDAKSGAESGQAAASESDPPRTEAQLYHQPFPQAVEQQQWR